MRVDVAAVVERNGTVSRVSVMVSMARMVGMARLARLIRLARFAGMVCAGRGRSEGRRA